jgi:hypothetical protein
MDPTRLGGLVDRRRASRGRKRESCAHWPPAPSSEYRRELRAEQQKLAADKGMYYPLMKLADMYFWQIGYEAARASSGAEPEI